MNDRKPTPEQLAVVSAAHLARGRFVACYAHVEFLLADLVMRCRYNDDRLKLYHPVAKQRFPYQLDKRVSRVKALLEIDGILSPYRTELLALLDGLNPFEDHRHFMAHGFMRFDFMPSGRHRIFCKLYRPKKGVAGDDDAEAGEMTFTLPDIEFSADALSKHAGRVIKIMHRICVTENLSDP